jgi:ParB-like chromosome segregation protein Spo0J
MAFDLTGMLGSNENQVQQIPVERLVPYYKHPFQLYQGERLQDMVDSIQKNGILVPLVVRPCMGDYEILVGHNRWNAAKLAGLSAVPAIVKSNLSEEEAEMYVIESNLMQRGFDNLKISEQAAVVAMRRDQMFSQGKRNDIIRELQELEQPDGKKLTADKVGSEYGLSRNSVTRLVRINSLHPEIKKWVDAGLAMRTGVELSFLPMDGQTLLAETMLEKLPDTDTNYTIIRKLLTEKRAKALQQPAKTKPAPVSMPEEIQNCLHRLNQKTMSDFERAVARGEWSKMESQLGKDSMLRLIQHAMQCRHPEAQNS